MVGIKVLVFVWRNGQVFPRDGKGVTDWKKRQEKEEDWKDKRCGKLHGLLYTERRNQIGFFNELQAGMKSKNNVFFKSYIYVSLAPNCLQSKFIKSALKDASM